MQFPRLLNIATKVVKDTLLSLPTNIRHEAEDCRIEFSEMDALIDIDEDLDPDLLGLFEGNTRSDPLPESPDEMPRIRLFLDNLWDECGGELSTYRHEVRITFLHELGHYLGLDEDEVAELGLA
ncbi:metallopeptidase family protein [Prosthecobacter fluviatilis]|uniref:Metallopeptidase family protein n=1 Tax=Prosthecobacter fluviatilis TaxID=445931 RepID=A0ABW0KJ78_9BACT